MAELQGSELKALRDNMRIGQDALAARLGIYKQTVHDVESGEISVDGGTYLRWSQALWALHDDMEDAARERTDKIEAAIL